MSEHVRLLVDPACPWAWQTARWIREVESVRDVRVRWGLFSLALVNRRPEEPDPLTDPTVRSAGALRTLALVEREHGNEGLARLYAAIGVRVHERKERLGPEVVRAALADVGHPEDLLDRALADGATAEEVRRAHAEAVDSYAAFGVPTLVLGSGRAIFGPVVAVAPTGEDAGETWDHVRWLADRDGFFELKRERDRPAGG